MEEVKVNQTCTYTESWTPAGWFESECTGEVYQESEIPEICCCGGKVSTVYNEDK